ncbi:lytic transglycosylase domain-containing protein [Novosphingobium sediminicola]|uniref:lytic transglycosylase domain-containing protein n=1 Tax=Novosphingobium sediminicola TaxID=563162 RepID=UPI00160ABA39|nr:lytic transglycosylase domain-containing protein [Novosphingobium sediminicola]
MKVNWQMTWIAVCLSAASISGQATAAPLIREEPEIARCIRQAAQGSAWLEKTLWGLRDQEAGGGGAEVANTNGTHDLGVMQVNSSWVPRLARIMRRPETRVRSWLIYDPCFNTEVARWIFLSALSQTRDYWKAVGTYHSPTARRQQRYTVSFAVHLRRRFGARLFRGAVQRQR